MKKSLLMMVAIALPSCSKSASDLLRAGDPHVCANTQVEDSLYGILKLHVGIPYSNDEDQSLNDAQRSYLERLSFSLSNVNSTNVDQQAQKIKCNATLAIVAPSSPHSISHDVDYEVAQDLANDGKIVVSADVSQTRSLMLEALNMASQPERVQAEKQKREAEEKEKKRSQAASNAMMAKMDAEGVAWRHANDQTVDEQLDCNADPSLSRMSCVVFHKGLYNDNPVDHVTFDKSKVNQYRHGSKDFAAVYSFLYAGTGQPGSVDMSVDGHGFTTDLSSTKPIVMWTITHDSGVTWSKLVTKDQGAFEY